MALKRTAKGWNSGGHSSLGQSGVTHTTSTYANYLYSSVLLTPLPSFPQANPFQLRIRQCHAYTAYIRSFLKRV
jgi:hypothetical protein